MPEEDTCPKCKCKFSVKVDGSKECGCPKEEHKPEPESEEPQPIEFKATYYPDGRLHVSCPLMANPMLMLGFLEFVKDGTKAIMEGKNSEDKPRIQKPNGGYFNQLRSFLK